MEERKADARVSALAASSEDCAEVDVTVLTKNNWPSARFPACALPPAVALPAELFRDYYLAVNNSRRLEWLTEKGTADVVFHLGGGKRYELSVSTYQMCVLLLFNAPSGAAEGIPFSAMVRALGVPAPELLRHVLSIANPKHRILNKSSKVREGGFFMGGFPRSAPCNI